MAFGKLSVGMSCIMILMFSTLGFQAGAVGVQAKSKHLTLACSEETDGAKYANLTYGGKVISQYLLPFARGECANSVREILDHDGIGCIQGIAGTLRLVDVWNGQREIDHFGPRINDPDQCYQALIELPDGWYCKLEDAAGRYSLSDATGVKDQVKNSVGDLVTRIFTSQGECETERGRRIHKPNSPRSGAGSPRVRR